MRWISITLDGYLPFSHTGTKHIFVEFTNKVTCILASNGFGKSSLLRALTPYPATRTDFSKNGYVKKVIKHDGHVYELSSNFKNVSKPHSFIEDGNELNVSGTQDTQKDLVEEKFGITTLIDGLMSGAYNLCNMTKSERKQLFSATYPSDLTFVLDKHKKVCSQIRVFGNQIKLLAQREVSLKTNLMTDNQLNGLSIFRDQLNDIINRIDKINLLLESEISRIKCMSEYSNSSSASEMNILGTEEWIDTLDTLRTEYARYRAIYPKLFHGSRDIDSLVTESTIISNRAFETCKMLNESKDTCLKRINDTRNQLDELTKCKETTNQDEKNNLERIIQSSEMAINNLPKIARTVYTISKDNVDYIETIIYKEIYDLIVDIHPYSGKLITRKEIDSIENEIKTLTMCVNNLNADLISINENINFFDGRIANLKKRSYPMFCKEVCALRDSVSKMIKETEAQRDLKVKSKCEHDKQIKEYSDTIESLKSKVVGPSKAIPKIEALWIILSENYLDKFALNGRNFVELLNTDCFEIVNRIHRLIEESKVVHAIEEYQGRIQLAKEKLEVYKTAEKASLSLEALNGLILTKSSELDEYYEQLDTICREIKIADEYNNAGHTVSYLLKKISTMAQTSYAAVNYRYLHTRVEFDEMLLKEHINIRNEINSKLREMETTISEQTSIRNILNNEVIPTLRQLEKDKKQWECVEYGLSPITGLPFIYLVRFINKLIERANSYIKEVWCYPMELVYLKEEDTLDFSIEVLINQSSIVKDISICSEGQKSIVNLAIMLAIYAERKFTQVYPVKLDEVDAPLTDEHRTCLIKLLNRLVNEPVANRTEEIKQMFLINHFALQTGMANCGMVCLSTDGIELPERYNENVEIY